MNRGKDLASESTSSSFSWYRGGFSGVPNLENIFRKEPWKGTLTPPIIPCLMEALWNVPPPLLLPTPDWGLDLDTCDHFDHLLYFLIQFFFIHCFHQVFPSSDYFPSLHPPNLCSLFQKTKQNTTQKKEDETHRKKIKTSRRLRRHNKSKRNKSPQRYS